MNKLRFATLIALLMGSLPASAAFSVVAGVGSVTTTGTAPNSAATSGTGNISSTNFLSWNVVGSDNANLGSTINGPFSTSGGTVVSAVYLVSTSVNPTLPGAPATISGDLQRRTQPFSWGGAFTNNEPVLFSGSGTGLAMIIDFATPVQAAGFRIQQDNFGSPTDLFIRGFQNNGAGFSEISVAGNTNLFSVSTSTPDDALFYGLTGGSPTETFSRLFVGFSSGAQFSIGTLEVIPGSVPPPPSGPVVPVPPTFALGLVGFAGLRLWQRRRNKA